MTRSRKKTIQRVRDTISVNGIALRELRKDIRLSQSKLMLEVDLTHIGPNRALGDGYISDLERNGGHRDRRIVEAIERALKKLSEEVGIQYRSIRDEEARTGVEGGKQDSELLPSDANSTGQLSTPLSIPNSDDFAATAPQDQSGHPQSICLCSENDKHEQPGFSLLDRRAADVPEPPIEQGVSLGVQAELRQHIIAALTTPSGLINLFSHASPLQLATPREAKAHVDDPSRRVKVFTDRPSMIAYFLDMYARATSGDVIWAQGIGHTAYPTNLQRRLRALRRRGVDFEIIINKLAPTAEEFAQLLRSAGITKVVFGQDNAMRIQGLSTREVLISIPSTELYTAVAITDMPVAAIFREWFCERFRSLSGNTKPRER